MVNSLKIIIVRSMKATKTVQVRTSQIIFSNIIEKNYMAANNVLPSIFNSTPFYCQLFYFLLSIEKILPLFNMQFYSILLSILFYFLQSIEKILTLLIMRLSTCNSTPFYCQLFYFLQSIEKILPLLIILPSTCYYSTVNYSTVCRQ